MNYSKSEIKRIASTIINKSIDKKIIREIDLNKLFIIEKANDEEIMSVTLNSVLINEILNEASDLVSDNLRLIEDRKYDQLKDFNITEKNFLVPISLIFNSSFSNNIGPKVPITLKMLGNVTSGIKSDIKEYGINNSLITISIEIEVEMMVILPLSTENISITNYIPLAIRLIQGKVPNYYGGSLTVRESGN